MMDDSRKVHVLVERDPTSDPPKPVPGDADVLLYSGGDVWTARRAHVGTRVLAEWWTELPTTSDLTVEDMQTLIAAALGDASQEEHDAENQGPTKAAHYRRSATETREAVARVKAALGMETP